MTERHLEVVAKNSERWATVRAEFANAQGNRCAICREWFTEDKPPRLDHCHHTHFVRGALCTSCNVKLGWYEKRRPAIENYLAQAAVYIARSVPAPEAREALTGELSRWPIPGGQQPKPRLSPQERRERQMERLRRYYLRKHAAASRARADSQAASAEVSSNGDKRAG